MRITAFLAVFFGLALALPAIVSGLVLALGIVHALATAHWGN